MKVLPAIFKEWDPKGPVERRVAVLMSGGVDSSTTAHILREEGWEVCGITMKIPMSCNPSNRTCCGADAVKVCNAMDIPHYLIDVVDEFQEQIIERFRAQYAAGRTPNPCADCNTYLKYSAVLELVMERFGVGRIASGHYARIEETAEGPVLKRGLDRNKDQTYFLYGIRPDCLKHLMFPLGSMPKSEVRRIAKDSHLPVWDKAESMELCFCGDDYRNGLKQEDMPGDIVDSTGRVLGRHSGIANFTIGQRKGLGIATGEPVYVIDVRADENRIVVGSREQAEVSTVSATLESVFMPQRLSSGAGLSAKVRSYGDPAPCVLEALENDFISVSFEQPILAPSPGQILAVYDDQDRLLAGGTIDEIR